MVHVDLRKLLNFIEDKKRDAEAHGSKLLAICIPEEYEASFMKAVEIHKPSSVLQVSRKNSLGTYIHSVFVVWSKGKRAFCLYRGGK